MADFLQPRKEQLRGERSGETYKGNDSISMTGNLGCHHGKVVRPGQAH
ncbi:MAG: hypothetical protein PHD01_02565 [Geobacteraceae bacterium]|nr:hypothetical protein [Geobacteraceae bacterium]